MPGSSEFRTDYSELELVLETVQERERIIETQATLIRRLMPLACDHVAEGGSLNVLEFLATKLEGSGCPSANTKRHLLFNPFEVFDTFSRPMSARWRQGLLDLKHTLCASKEVCCMALAEVPKVGSLCL